MFQAVLFDLDGTLLPMNQEEFVKGYFGALCRRFGKKGYDPKRIVDTVWKGTAAMVRNDGSCPNRDRFWAVFAEDFGRERLRDVPEFDDFYGRAFNEADAPGKRLRKDAEGKGLSGGAGHHPHLPARGHALARALGRAYRRGLFPHHHQQRHRRRSRQRL